MADDIEQHSIEPLSLEKAATHLLEECRMVLPGIQALFGFQLVAVFSARFAGLSPGEQRLHLAAILCVVLSVALVMAPAALHRLREPRSVSVRFIQLSSRMLMWGMAPLAVGTTLDVFLVARVIMGSMPAALVTASVTLLAFIALWAVFPASARLETAAKS
jgi:hypothetical protein